MACDSANDRRVDAGALKATTVEIIKGVGVPAGEA